MDENENPMMRNILIAIAFVAVGSGFTIVIAGVEAGRGDAIFVLIGFMVPLITFMGISYIMYLFKRKVQSHLNETFGSNVVRIASAIMDYFQFPLTLLLSISITLLFFAFALMAIAYWSLRYNI
ncbi:MAG: hypothetical protein AAB229_07740 [Candidatus Hydrogenedentota bacterium]